MHTDRDTARAERVTNVPCVWGFRTSISRKLSGTLYISSIWTPGLSLSQGTSGGGNDKGLTVCSRPAIRVSSKPLRAKGDTAEAIGVVIVKVDEQAGAMSSSPAEVRRNGPKIAPSFDHRHQRSSQAEALVRRLIKGTFCLLKHARRPGVALW